MASVVYNTFKQKIMTGEVDLDTNTINCALLANTYTADIDAHTAWSDVSSHEVSGTGYTSLGATLTGVTVTRDLTNDKGIFDATNDVTWANSTITARYAVLYKYVAGSSTTSWLICCFDFTTDKSSSNGDFTIQWNASGILNLS